MTCPRCSSSNVYRNGTKQDGTRQDYKCKDCSRHFLGEHLMPKSKAKIFLFDIETTPMLVTAWSTMTRRVNISDQQIQRDWVLISWAGKWLGDKEVISMVQTKEEAIAGKDQRLVEGLWQIFDEADILIAHNGDNFDIPMMNAKFITAGLIPPSPYRTIDTLKIAYKVAKFTKNKLDYLGKIFNLGRKTETEYQLWLDCMKGNEAALDYMDKYNRQDVQLLEDVYLRLRPWMRNHPSISSYSGHSEACPSCGTHGTMELLDKKYIANVQSYDAYRCSNCGAIVRERTPNKDVIVGQYMSVAR